MVLQIAVPVALLLIFFLLFITFRSVKEALIIFVSVPFMRGPPVYKGWCPTTIFHLIFGEASLKEFSIHCFFIDTSPFITSYYNNEDSDVRT